MRKKIGIAIDAEFLAVLQNEAKERNLSLSRLIENDLKRIRGLVK
jgi:hypothetical protein